MFVTKGLAAAATALALAIAIPGAASALPATKATGQHVDASNIVQVHCRWKHRYYKRCRYWRCGHYHRRCHHRWHRRCHY